MTTGESRITEQAQGSSVLDTMDPADMRNFPDHHRSGEGVSKHMHNIALWQQARVTLIRIFHLHSHHDNAQMQATRKLLQRLGISPKTYTFAHHNADSIVYMRFTLDRQFSKFRYIGCSQHNLQHREACRNRKHKQVKEHKIAHAELAIRWWAKNNNYHRFVPITWRQWKPHTHSSCSPSSTIRILHLTRANRCGLFTNKGTAKQQDSGAFGPKSGASGCHRGCKTSTSATPSHHRSAHGHFCVTLAPTQEGDSRASEPCYEAAPAPRAYSGCAVWQATSPMSTNKPHRRRH